MPTPAIQYTPLPLQTPGTPLTVSPLSAPPPDPERRTSDSSHVTGYQLRERALNSIPPEELAQGKKDAGNCFFILVRQLSLSDPLELVGRWAWLGRLSTFMGPS